MSLHTTFKHFSNSWNFSTVLMFCLLCLLLYSRSIRNFINSFLSAPNFENSDNLTLTCLLYIVKFISLLWSQLNNKGASFNSHRLTVDAATDPIYEGEFIDNGVPNAFVNSSQTSTTVYGAQAVSTCVIGDVTIRKFVSIL